MSSRSRKNSKYSAHDNSDLSSDDGSTDTNMSVSTSNKSNRSTSTKSRNSDGSETNENVFRFLKDPKKSHLRLYNLKTPPLSKKDIKDLKKSLLRLYNLKTPPLSKNDIKIRKTNEMITQNKETVSKEYKLIRNSKGEYPSKITEKQFQIIFNIINKGSRRNDDDDGFQNILMTPLDDGNVYPYAEILRPDDFRYSADYYIKNDVYNNLLEYVKTNKIGGSNTRRRNKNKRKSKRRTNHKNKRKTKRK
jgi:hypothetical protein